MLGYTQGVNFLVGFLLIELQESSAFKCFSAIALHEELMLLGLFEDQFPLVGLYCRLFWKTLEAMAPQINSRLRMLAVPPEMWLFQWFICLFLYNLPLAYAPSIISFVIVEKGFALVRIALATIMGVNLLLRGASDQLEDEFVQCLESLKDEEYCLKNLPLSEIISTATTIEEKEIARFLEAGS